MLEDSIRGRVGGRRRRVVRRRGRVEGEVLSFELENWVNKTGGRRDGRGRGGGGLGDSVVHRYG